MVVAAHLGLPSEPIMSALGGRSAEIEVKFLAIEIYLVRHSKEHSKFCTRVVILCAVMILSVLVTSSAKEVGGYVQQPFRQLAIYRSPLSRTHFRQDTFFPALDLVLFS